MTDKLKTPKSAMTHTIIFELPVGVSLVPDSPPRELTLEVREVWDFRDLVAEMDAISSKLISL